MSSIFVRPQCVSKYAVPMLDVHMKCLHETCQLHVTDRSSSSCSNFIDANALSMLPLGLTAHTSSATYLNSSVKCWAHLANKIIENWSGRAWASYQIRKIAGCVCAGNAGNVFPRRRFQRKLLVSDPGMHHGTCVTHVPWCMSGSLTCGDGENVPGIPSACAPAILRIWQEAHASQEPSEI